MWTGSSQSSNANIKFKKDTVIKVIFLDIL